MYKRKHPISPVLKVVGNKLAACHDVAFSKKRAWRGEGKKLELKYKYGTCKPSTSLDQSG
jgi:hypothetical protein